MIPEQPIITLFLEPELDYFVVTVALVLYWLGDSAVGGREDLRRLGRQLGWCHGGVSFLLLLNRYFPSEASELLLIILRSVLSAWLCGGAWRIALPVLAAIYEGTIGTMWQKLLRLGQDLTRQMNAIRMPKPLPPSHSVPSVETTEQQQEREQLLEQQRLAEAQRLAGQLKREESRLRSELLYERHARQLASSFPRDRFEQFVERFMGEATTPELVVQREQLLKEMIVDSLGTTTTPKFATMTELAAFFAARRLEIGNLPHSEDVRDTYLVQLNKQEDEALRKFLKP